MHPSIPTDHPRHDASLIAGHAAGDLADPDRIRATALLDSCPACADLHRDLIAIRAATRAVPAPASRSRDFRLSPDQASRLRSGSWVRAILRPFGSARSATRPLAAAFTSVGVAGLLVASILPGMLGGPASGTADRELAAGAGQGGGAPVPAASGAPVGNPEDNAQGQGQGLMGSPVAPAIEVEPTGSVDPDKVTDFSLPPSESNAIAIAAGGTATDGGGPGSGEGTDVKRLSETVSPPNLLLFGSLGLLVLGLSLFGLGFAARRVR